MKKFFTIILTCLLCSCAFAELKFGIAAVDKIYIGKDSAYNMIGVRPKMDISIYKGLEFTTEFEIAGQVPAENLYLTGNLILGLQYSFKLPKDFYIRPNVKFSVCGFIGVAEDTGEKTYSSGGAFEGGLSFAKRFYIEKNFYEFYATLSCQTPNYSKQIPLCIGLGFSYGLPVCGF